MFWQPSIVSRLELYHWLEHFYVTVEQEYLVLRVLDILL